MNLKILIDDCPKKERLQHLHKHDPITPCELDVFFMCHSMNPIIDQQCYLRINVTVHADHAFTVIAIIYILSIIDGDQQKCRIITTCIDLTGLIRCHVRILKTNHSNRLIGGQFRFNGLEC
ncbi:hypothetical protein DERF_008131 [Dermatophagoides farinae]|uniref:Uncharacterized protein n=1 Tax=Dermatophagoides farinae TaxID=6954 RepID=A0A922I0D9_DERFA|nr:hypothetical protein DERF_008131 [Dermatophagoides farinae]